MPIFRPQRGSLSESLKEYSIVHSLEDLREIVSKYLGLSNIKTTFF